MDADLQEKAKIAQLIARIRAKKKAVQASLIRDIQKQHKK
jgi:hypothetical protein